KGADQDLLGKQRTELKVRAQRFPVRPKADGMQGVYQTLALLSWKLAQFWGEDLLDLGTSGRVAPFPVAGQLIGERLVHPGRPPGWGHLFEHPGALVDERFDPRGEGLVRIDPGDQ